MLIFSGIFRQTESRNHLLCLPLTASNFQLFRELQTKNPLKIFCPLQKPFKYLPVRKGGFFLAITGYLKHRDLLKRQYVFPKPRKRYHLKG